MTSREIRKHYLAFFETHEHKVIPRANLVPQDDPTTLFTGSGMQPLVPYLLGAQHPEGKRLTNSQTSLRAEDIEEVGDNRHTTFFEMLGNWSLGDYYKKEQLPWLFEFLTEIVGLDPQKLYVTCFIGDKKLNIPRDSESAELWQKLFKSKDIDAKTIDIGSEKDGYEKGMSWRLPAGRQGRIFFYDGNKNWWSRGGSPADTPVGDPCGPDSEVFYDFGTPHNEKYGKHCHPNCDCGRFLEIGNSVFMAYERTDKGFIELKKPNVDFGAGLERIEAASNNDPDMFKISLIWPVIENLQLLSGKNYKDYEVGFRVIADHLRAAFWLAVDGLVPSNKEQGYVMRRLLRRAIHYGLKLGIEHNLAAQCAPVIADLYSADFSEVKDQTNNIITVFDKEERLFRQTLKKGVKELQKLTKGGKLDGQLIFTLYDTYGFPVELSLEEADAHGVEVDRQWKHDFDHLMQEQKERSRTATVGQFRGGLGGHSDTHKRYHTATHLMYKALRLVLGDHVIQRGSNITEERTRFDFSHSQKMTAEEIKKVEAIVNEQIKKDLPVGYEEIPTKEALAKGALGAFGDKYGDKVKVYAVGKGKDRFSFEICGGPHVDSTGQVGDFKIIKEESSSAGVRRIKAVVS